MVRMKLFHFTINLPYLDPLFKKSSLDRQELITNPSNVVGRIEDFVGVEPYLTEDKMGFQNQHPSFVFDYGSISE